MRDRIEDFRFEVHDDGTPEWFDGQKNLLVKIDEHGNIAAYGFEPNEGWSDYGPVDRIETLATMIRAAREYATEKIGD